MYKCLHGGNVAAQRLPLRSTVPSVMGGSVLKSVDNWMRFEEELQKVEDQRALLKKEGGFAIPELLFRGLASSNWQLETTLELSFPLENNRSVLSFLEYYGKIMNARSAVETLTDSTWSEATGSSPSC